MGDSNSIFKMILHYKTKCFYKIYKSAVFLPPYSYDFDRGQHSFLGTGYFQK